MYVVSSPFCPQVGDPGATALGLLSARHNAALMNVTAARPRNAPPVEPVDSLSSPNDVRYNPFRHTIRPPTTVNRTRMSLI